MNYGSIKKHDIANGLGVRVSLFVSGCTHHCPGCFNQETWDFNYGIKYTSETQKEIIEALNHEYISGLTLIGGEPFEPSNQEVLVGLVKESKNIFPNKNIWCYTGYKFDEDVEENMFENWPETKELMSYIDVVVDGKFEEDKKDLSLKFRGSKNQRIIDVQKSLKTHQIIPYEV